MRPNKFKRVSLPHQVKNVKENDTKEKKKLRSYLWTHIQENLFYSKTLNCFKHMDSDHMVEDFYVQKQEWGKASRSLH